MYIYIYIYMYRLVGWKGTDSSHQQHTNQVPRQAPAETRLTAAQLTLKPRTPAKARRLTPLWGRGAVQQT